MILSKYLVKPIQLWGLVHVSQCEKLFFLFYIPNSYLINMYLSIVNGGGVPATGINLSSFGFGFHTVDGAE